MTDINRLIVSKFIAFTNMNSKHKTLGTCDEASTTLVDMFLKDIKLPFTISQGHGGVGIQVYTGDEFVCEIKKIQSIAVFDCIKKFTLHCNRLHNDFIEISSNKQSFGSIPCLTLYGLMFEYRKHGYVRNTKQKTFGVGLQHFVVEVKLQNGIRYLLDPTVSQFEHLPAYLIVPEA